MLNGHNNHSVRRNRGFTVIELVIVIAVIGIITGYVVAYLPTAQLRARDSDRVADVQTIARFMEQSYVENSSATYPTYPATTTLVSELTLLTTKGLADAAKAPGSSSSSISAAADTADKSSITTKDTYIYQPFLSSGALCTSSSAAQPCVRFKLWYRLEENNPAASLIESKHQQ